MTSDIFEVIENSLSRAGYKVLWGEGASIVIQHANSDRIGHRKPIPSGVG